MMAGAQRPRGRFEEVAVLVVRQSQLSTFDIDHVAAPLVTVGEEHTIIEGPVLERSRRLERPQGHELR